MDNSWRAQHFRPYPNLVRYKVQGPIRASSTIGYFARRQRDSTSLSLSGRGRTRCFGLFWWQDGRKMIALATSVPNIAALSGGTPKCRRCSDEPRCLLASEETS
jgi:hypothetical protein